jgi:DNA-binding MarR family transcriptional regulator
VYYDIHKSVGYQIAMLARSHEKRIELFLSEHGLTRITWVVLVAVGANSLSQPSKIAEYLGIDRPVVSRAIAALEDLGLVVRLKSAPGDARKVVVQVTREGTARIETIAPKTRAANDEFLAPLSDEDKLEFQRLLSILASHRPSLPHI